MATKNKNNQSRARIERGSRHRTAPVFVTPMAAQLVKDLPEGDEWIYEIKFDGYRGLLIKDGTRFKLRSRNDKDVAPMYPAIAQAGLALKADQAVVDGEIVALDAQGRPSSEYCIAMATKKGFHD